MRGGKRWRWLFALPPLVGLAAAAWSLAHPQPAAPWGSGRLRTANSHQAAVQFDVLAKLLADDRRASADAWLTELADPHKPVRVATQPHPLLGKPAPAFTLDAAADLPWSLQARLERGPVILVFYLGYTCSACVHELFELNADLSRFHALGAEVVAISGDAPELTRRRFAEFGTFDFAVLADPGHAVARSYGTFRPATDSEPEELLHGTFVIDRAGRVCWSSRGALPFRAHKALLCELARIDGKLPRSAVAQGQEP
jgi:peroxiredoxin